MILISFLFKNKPGIRKQIHAIRGSAQQYDTPTLLKQVIYTFKLTAVNRLLVNKNSNYFYAKNCKISQFKYTAFVPVDLIVRLGHQRTSHIAKPFFLPVNKYITKGT